MHVGGADVYCAIKFIRQKVIRLEMVKALIVVNERERN